MRKLVTVDRINEVKPIEGADKIEAIQVRGWWVVAKKGEFKVGSSCVFFEIDSFLPVKPEYEFLLRGSSPKMMVVDGKEIEGIRLRTIKLRGQLSQGLALPVPDGFPTEFGTDVTDLLGVIKYEAYIPPCLSGVAKGNFPSFIPKTDEERIQNMKGVLCGFYVTEKLDGSSTTFYKKDGVFGVCSRNLELVDGDTTQWKIAKNLDLANKLPDNMAIQCELVGEGIQGNPLRLKGKDIYAFSVYNIAYGKYLDFSDFIGICISVGIKTVPIVDVDFSLPKTISDMLSYAEGKSLLNKNEEREGVVVRPKREMSYRNGRLSFKAISNKYLLKESN